MQAILATTFSSLPRRIPGLLATATVLLLLALSAGPAGGQSDTPSKAEAEALEKASAAERSKAKQLETAAEALRRETLDLKVRLVGLARKARDTEQDLDDSERRLRELEARAGERAASLRANRHQLYRAMTALQTLALAPRQVLLTRAAEPIDLLRGAFLLRTRAPALRAREQDLKEEELLVASLTQSIASERRKLRLALAAFMRERDDLVGLMQEKRGQEANARQALSGYAAQAEKLAAEARDLRDLMARLEAAPARTPEVAAADPEQAALPKRKPESDSALVLPESTPPESATPESATSESGAPETAAPEQSGETSQIAEARLRTFVPGPDQLVLPLQGEIRARFGQSLGAEHGYGSESRGLLIGGRPGAVVLAPYDGRVVYAGPFRSFGLILIIDHGDSYHSLLAGLGRIEVVVGQWVLAGEPVGLGDTNLNESELYLELRHAGQPVDPLPWISMTGSKVRG